MTAPEPNWRDRLVERHGDDPAAYLARTIGTVQDDQPTKTRPGDQQLPNGGRECVQDALIKLIEERKQLGIERYGSPLMTHNGRDSVRDATEEALDLTVYLMQVAMEMADLRAERDAFKATVGDAIGRMATLRVWAYRELSGDTMHNALAVMTNVWDILDPDRTLHPALAAPESHEDATPARDEHGPISRSRLRRETIVAGADATAPEPLLDPDCRDGKCGSCVGGPCEHDCHTPPWMLEDAGILPPSMRRRVDFDTSPEPAPERTPPDDTTEDLRERYAEAATRWALMYPLANWPWPGRTLAGADAEHLDTIARDIAAAWGADIADRVLAIRDEELAEAQKRKTWAIEQADKQFRARRKAEAERDAFARRLVELGDEAWLGRRENDEVTSDAIALDGGE